MSTRTNSQISECFIADRQIIDNILLAQEVVRDYHLKGGQPICSLNVDIMKAFDSISWNFLIQLLQALDFLHTFVHWIDECVTSPKYSINLNGQAVGFFSGQRELRQGDPLSPYLFVLCMQVFSELLIKAVNEEKVHYHATCSKIKLSHLCFADDLIIFTAATQASLLGVFSILTDFHSLFGLQVSIAKCENICGGVDELTVGHMASS